MGVQEIAVGASVLLILGIVSLVCVSVFSNYYDNAYNSTDSSYGKQFLDDTKNTLPAYDNFMIIALFLVIVSLVIGAYFLKDNPVFIPIAIILFILALVVVPIIANTYGSLSEGNDDLAAASATYMTKTDSWMSNLLIIMIITGLLMILALYGVYKYVL